MKRRGNRRYYQHHEVLMIRRIRELLYDQGFTISGARNRLQELPHEDAQAASADAPRTPEHETPPPAAVPPAAAPLSLAALRKELEEIRALLF
jgi:DNA-binding transcriptional MerR regulator